MRRFIDLSIYLENDVISDPPMMQPKIEYIRHDAGAEQVKLFFDGLETDELPDSEGWAVEFVQLCTHNGTHSAATSPSRLTLPSGSSGAYQRLCYATRRAS